MEEHRSNETETQGNPGHGESMDMVQDKDELLRKKDSEIHELQEASMIKEMEINVLKSKLKEHEQNTDSHVVKDDSEEILILRTLCKDKEFVVDALNKQVESLQEEILAFQQQQTDANVDAAEFKELSAENEALKYDCISKNERIDGLLAQIKQLESVSESSNTISAENESLKADIKVKNERLETLQQQVEMLEENFAHHQNELKVFSAKGDEDQAIVDQLHHDLENAKGQIKELEMKLKTAEEEKTISAQELAHFQSTFPALEDSRNREEAKRKLLESNLEVLKDELAKSRAAYMESKRELDSLSSKKQSIQKDEFLPVDQVYAAIGIDASGKSEVEVTVVGLVSLGISLLLALIFSIVSW
ncbi:unnamed protein product [Notodromas monacha]|uniref:Uncharacterized protein n=1 Tax=Notodromas monacha TaxID=399045 RepID=A0A7R9BSN7_9CRUS|nr:unnamed protein product [Notodromas monacha]CAG0921005.1 unnamed protein product [Notodromas monacha]